MMPVDLTGIVGNKEKSGEAFGEIYTRIRERENRIYTDDEVALLPAVRADHPHYKEWLIRQRSASWLTRRVAKRSGPLSILEIGCGNGWLSSHLAKITSGSVLGMDVNLLELRQAERVFGGQANLRFHAGDIRNGVLQGKRFDVILFAASIQYFASFREIVHTALEYLNPDGEIYIMDTCFYRPEEIRAAKVRTEAYYASIGFPLFSGCYYHHSFNDLKEFNSRILYDPSSIAWRFSGKRIPFYHICIKDQSPAKHK